MLLIFTLETIYAVTSMGIRSCQLMLQVHGILDQLVSLISVEAQSYGSDGCVMMRVVETVPGNMLPMVAQNISNLQNVTMRAPLQVSAANTTTAQVQPEQTTNTEIVAEATEQTTTTVAAPPTVITATTIAATIIKKSIQTTVVSVAPAAKTEVITKSSVATPTQLAPPTTNQFTKDDEQYALTWLSENFERASGIEFRIEQNEMYREYLQHCQRSGKLSIVNQAQFPRLVRTIFGNNVGPAIVRRVDGTEYAGIHYVAIKHKIAEKVIMTPVITSAPTLLTSQTTTTTTTAVPAITNIVRLKKKTLQEQLEEQTKKQNIAITTQTTLPTLHNAATTTSTIVQQSQILQPPPQQQQQAQPSTSLIKSLLANKVNQRQQKQKDVVTQANIINQQQQQQQQSPIKVTSNTISALVSNPLMQNTLVKVGQTTIKPLNPQLSMEKKHMMEASSSVPPPLAPLSGNNVTIKDNTRSVIMSGNESMLLKRKLEDNKQGLVQTDAPNIKRLAYDASGSVIAIVSNNSNNAQREESTPVTPSKNAANLYAEMAASILEDEDLEDIPTLLTHSQPAQQTPTVITKTVSEATQQTVVLPTKMQTNSVTLPMPRQLLFQTSNQSNPIKLTTNTAQPTAMATIKTEQGLQTVPVILQQKTMDASLPPHLVLQQQQAPHTTQYVLATNQQGQTYLVAQQTTAPAPPPPPAQPTQTVLVTQTAQQQSTGSKTIIILQQQALPGQQQVNKQTHLAAGQKMIMTSQAQPLLLTQRTTNTPVSTATSISSTPIIINPGTGNAALTTALLQRQLQQQQQTNTGRISPTLLSQLNHIPATIKLHQPNMITSTPCSSVSTATITRVAKPMNIVHTQPLQLQQHASLIQQHIIGGAAPAEKRQVILTGGGRAIEIKETVMPQTALLNSQTIITHSPHTTDIPTTAVVQQQKAVTTNAPMSVSNIIMQQNKPAILLETTAVNTSTSQVMPRTGVIARMPSQATFGVIKSEPPPLAMSVDKEQDVMQKIETPPPIATTTAATATPPTTTAAATVTSTIPIVDPNWLYICDWRNCPRKKFNSINDLQHHVCTAHCPEHLDPAAEIFCQWGAGSNLCDGIPRKRYSLMTHLIDRHITVESLRQSLQRRLSSGATTVPANQQPVTIIRNMNDVQRANSASPALSGSSSTTASVPAMGSSALQAIKRHTADFANSRELLEENEGPVTKSIRLTAALILRNIVTYAQGAKRSLRRYEPHLSNIALSNVESSGTISHILFELNN